MSKIIRGGSISLSKEHMLLVDPKKGRGVHGSVRSREKVNTSVNYHVRRTFLTTLKNSACDGHLATELLDRPHVGAWRHVKVPGGQPESQHIALREPPHWGRGQLRIDLGQHGVDDGRPRRGLGSVASKRYTLPICAKVSMMGRVSLT